MMTESKVLKVIAERYSVRDYADRPVAKTKLDQVLEAGRLAPSASNSQPWHFYIVTNRPKIAALAERMPLHSQVIANAFIARAPVVIVATAGPLDLLHRIASFIVNKKWYYIDLGIALEHMVLTAWELGIGSCWIGWFDEKRVKTILGLPAGEEVVALLTLGYPSGERPPWPKSRKSLKEITRLID
jgi:nitroreductase